MGRMQRIVLPGNPLHIMHRGNNRSATFFAEEDYRSYLDSLEYAINTYDCALHAYVLMTNHVHLLLTSSDEQGASRLMQSVGRRYVRYINDKYKRTGTLWEGRYKSSLIDSDNFLLTCYRYIELNPVRAGMVEQPGEYSWSSYRGNTGLENNRLISTHQLFDQLGKDNKERVANYISLFAVDIDDLALSQIRSSTNTDTVIGSPRFIHEIELMLDRRITKTGHGGDRKSERFKMRNFNDLSSTLIP